MNYRKTLEYLDSFVDYEKQDNYDYNTLGLERIKRLLDFLGSPQEKIRAVQIAGTKGKGSTSIFVSSILREAGFRIGLYTSPHLVDFRERIRILHSEGSSLARGVMPQWQERSCKRVGERKRVHGLGEIITREEICALVEEMKPQIERVHREVGMLTFFEVVTALAFLYFSIKEIDFMVLEVGLGGRLDATNVVKALVCGITPISREHTDKLGTTLEEIAREKSGIIKDNISPSALRRTRTILKQQNISPSLLQNQIVISAVQKKEAMEVIRETCKEKNARLYEVNKEIFFEEVSFSQEKQVFNVKGIWGEYPLLDIKLLGEHQLLNAATAIGIVEGLRFQDIFISACVIKKGLQNARWPGRLEIVKRNPLIVLDGAQTRESASVLRKAVRKFFNYEKLILILGLSKDKDISGVCRELAEITDRVILTQAESPRAANPGLIRQYIHNKDITLTHRVGEAMRKARLGAKKGDLILVTGSLFVVGEAKVYLFNGGEDLCV